MNKQVRPSVAILSDDTLSAIGLSTLLKKMMPGAQAHIFPDFDSLQKAGTHFFHFFISSRILLAHAAFFLPHVHKTIVLVRGEETGLLPQHFHTIHVGQSEEALVRDFYQLARASHGSPGKEPEIVRQAQTSPSPSPTLTPRESEVLRGIVAGKLNKEIAETMGVGMATVISHRKHIVSKLGTRSVSALTIYAVTHGLAEAEEI